MKRFLFIAFIFYHAFGLSQNSNDLSSGNDTIEFSVLEQKPVYPGGFASFIKFISDKFNSSAPGKCDAHGCKTFRVKFIISTAGEINNVSVSTSIDDCPAFEAELIRVFKLSPKWEPGYLNGKAVNTYYTLSIKPRFP